MKTHLYVEPALKDVWRVKRAIKLLRAARDELKDAQCPRATDKVRRALKSAEGAERHVRHRHLIGAT